MKKLICLICFCVTSILCEANYQTALYYNGRWDRWQPHGWGSFSLALMSSNNYTTFDGFVFYMNSEDDRCFQFSIDDYKKPNKNEIKEHWKKKEPFIYSGWAEYYVCEKYPTIKEAFSSHDSGCSLGQLPVLRPSLDKYKWLNLGPIVKRRAKASIKIAPYKKYPEYFYIFFDNVGVGIYKKIGDEKNWKKYFE